jgi:hypothetical protein
MRLIRRWIEPTPQRPVLYWRLTEDDYRGRAMAVRVLLLTLAVAALANACSSGRKAHAIEVEGPASVPVASQAEARRIAAVWGSSLTFLPTWAPNAVAPSHWSSSTCACASPDSRLIVEFKRRDSSLD